MTNDLLERDKVARKSGHGGKRPGAGRPKGERDDAVTRFDRRLLDMAKVTAKARGVPVAEYLSELNRKAIMRDFHAEMKRIGDSLEE